MSSNSRSTRLAQIGKWVLLLGLLGSVAFGARRAILGASVGYVHARRGPLSQRLVLTGRVITPGTARLGVVTLGTVRSVHVEAGSRVSVGQPLLELIDAEQRAAVAQARAGVLLSSAQVGQVQRITNRIASASVDEARVAVDQARREYQRTEQLARSDSVSVQVVDSARDALSAAESRLVAAEARAAGAKGPESQVAVAKNAEARAMLELAEARLAQTSVLAPADGTIIERDVEPGDIVQPGRVLLVLARDGATRLEAQADEKNLGRLRLGLKAKVSADGLPERPFAAELSWVSPAIDVERGTVTVRFSLTEAIAGLRPDMTVSINLQVEERTGVLLLPRTAVHDETTDHPWVLVLENGRARRVAIVTGVRDDREVELVRGIDEHARIIINAAGISDGARVRASGSS